MSAHGLPSFLSCADGLVLACWRLLWGDQASVASRQGLAHGNDGRLPIALEDTSVLTTSWVAPGPKLLVHFFHRPTFVTFSS